MLALDFALILFVIYLVTQIFLPLIFPKQLETNWIFKKRKPIDKLVQEKDNIKSAAKDIVQQSDKELQRIKENKDAANKLSK